MAEPAAVPNSDLVYNLYGGGFLGQFTRLALLLDVFTPLSAGPAGAESVAAACNADVTGIRALLDQLCSSEVLEYQPETCAYALTPSAAAFLVRGAKTYAGDWVLANTDPAMWDRMLDTIRSGEPAGYILPWAQDAWLESYSPSRAAYSLELWRTVGLETGTNRPLHLLDLACGCGIKTLALAQAHENVHVTCVDSPDVLEVARDLARRLGVEARTAFLPGDILADDFGTERFDAALLGLITYILTPEQNASVFRRAYRALRPGGRLVIDAIMASDRPSEWASRATLLMSTWNGGAAHSFADYRGWLEQAGFRVIVQHNRQWLSAVKSAPGREDKHAAVLGVVLNTGH
ncbi:MAG: methyltransferase domain-containing protein [Chloroflexi bacterium]|nr:MAG: methyltransferase domain-containing protein [Chloroflexota bacterium]